MRFILAENRARARILIAKISWKSTIVDSSIVQYNKRRFASKSFFLSNSRVGLELGLYCIIDTVCNDETKKSQK